jgi:hypothetical protein
VAPHPARRADRARVGDDALGRRRQSPNPEEWRPGRLGFGHVPRNCHHGPNHLSELRLLEGRNDAEPPLPAFLPLRGLRQATCPEAGRPLRLLFLRRSGLPAEAGCLALFLGALPLVRDRSVMPRRDVSEAPVPRGSAYTIPQARSRIRSHAGCEFAVRGFAPPPRARLQSVAAMASSRVR